MGAQLQEPQTGAGGSSSSLEGQQTSVREAIRRRWAADLAQAHTWGGTLAGRVRRWAAVDRTAWVTRMTSPLALFILVILVLAGIGGYALFGGFSATPATTGTHTMSGGSSAQTVSYPDATVNTGLQPAKYVLDSDGAKHFTLTAKEVMWEVVKGKRVHAMTLDGMVPGPMIRFTAGDHVRITIVNQMSQATALHMHGLQLPTTADGVPPLGQKPIEPGQSFTYDFVAKDSDAGTHWYHSHYNDLQQVGAGLYGGLIVDPRPGTVEAQQDFKADVDQTLFVGMLGGYYVINGKSFPDTQVIHVKQGQHVRFRLVGADTALIHPLHLHGHTFQVIASGGHMNPSPVWKDTLDVSPGDTYDVTFDAWAPQGSAYPLHCHILGHLMNPGQASMTEMGGMIALVQYDK